jgi:hypothetical protein
MREVEVKERRREEMREVEVKERRGEERSGEGGVI